MSALGSYSAEDIILIIMEVVIIVGAIMFHEISHGFAAYRLGDNTAKNAGRLSLNPLKHLDLFGSFILPLLLAISHMPVIGYAKPVPYNPNNLRNRKSGEVIVGLAGPAANLVLALVFALLANIVFNYVTTASGFLYWLWQFCAYSTLINLCLMFFNLIPLPPLDGSSLIAPFLSNKAMVTYYKIERYSMPILLIVLIVVPWLTGLDPVGWYIEHTAYSFGYFLLGL